MDSSDAMPVCDFSSWDDWTILELMDRLPLGELLRLGQASRRFNQLAKQNCKGRRELFLYIPRDDGPRLSVVYSITLQKLDRGTVERILDLLPGITWVEICNFGQPNGEVIDELVYLLEGWANQLVRLWMMMLFDESKPLYTFPLLGLVNRMHHLKKFEFATLCAMAEADWTALHLPVISQLEQFHFLTFNDGAPVVRQLLKYGTPLLSDISFNALHDVEIARRLAEFPPYLAKGLRSLELFTRDIDFSLLLAICKKFTSVEVLYLDLDLLTIGQLNRALAMLPKLHYISLNVYFSGRNPHRREAEEAAALLGEPFEADLVDGSQLVPLLSVTRLHLQLNLESHCDWEMLHLSKLFPNLEVLEFALPHEGMNMKRYYLLKKFQSKATFGEQFPELYKLTIYGKLIPEKDWQRRETSFKCTKSLRKHLSIVGRMGSFISKRLRSLAQKAINLVRPAQE